MTIFGKFTTPYAVEQAGAAFVEKWLPTYLAEFERQAHEPVESIERPLMYRVTRDPGDNWPEDQLPAVLVSADPGDPEAGNDGVGYWFTFRVSSIVGGLDEDDAIRVAQTYTAAVQALVMQRRDLDGLAEQSVPVGMEFPSYGDQSRTLARGEFTFRTFVPQIVDPHAGPVEPDPFADPDQEYDDKLIVSGVDFSVTARPVDGS